MVSNFLPAVGVPDSFPVFLLTDSVGMLGGEEKIPGTRRADSPGSIPGMSLPGKLTTGFHNLEKDPERTGTSWCSPWPEVGHLGQRSQGVQRTGPGDQGRRNRQAALLPWVPMETLRHAESHT